MQRGDFVYLDPPYDPKSASSNFTSYTKDGFGREDQVQLANVFRKLADRGCFILLSNSDTSFIRELYSGYDIKEVDTQRAINCKGDGRTGHKELIIFSNYLDQDSKSGGSRGEDYAQTKQESLDIFLGTASPKIVK
jgi:DNA adenine methylase Dam